MSDLALLTDLYQLTMLQSYHREGMEDEAVFDLYVRGLPESRNFLVAAGLEDALRYLEELSFSEEEIAYLETLNFCASYVGRMNADLALGRAQRYCESFGREFGIFPGEPRPPHAFHPRAAPPTPGSLLWRRT